VPPAEPTPVVSDCRITYVGHATVLVEMDGVRLITDPLLGRSVGPLRRRGPAPDPRLVEEIDAVLLSHLHHDHVHIRSLSRFDRAVPLLTAPGAGDLLARRGFASVTELAAGESSQVGGLRVSATEASHPGGRRLRSRAAQAIGFAIEGGRSVYFAGDTDIFPGMESLRGRFDAALLPVWGWGPSLGPGHLDPERAARAAALLEPGLAIPIHWGTFSPLGLARLRPDRLTSPPREFARRARELAPQVEVRVLSPGEATSVP
jgi:L-ascorbate metabolism protein UlaG (beta-lactamase superfamily)